MFGALRGSVGIACLRLAITPISHKRLDEDRLNHPNIRDPNSGVDRVLKIFDRDENDGSISPEASFISMFAFTGAYIGALYGGIVQSKVTNTNYRECNQAVVYDSNFAAKRALVDKTSIGFAKGAVRHGIRYAVFCTSFAGLSTVISTFRGDSGILEYTFGGMISGAVYKFYLGPRGMISGGFFGTLLGTFCGFVIYATTKISGIKMDDIYKLTQLYFKFQDKNFHGAERHTEEPDIIREIFHPYGVEIPNSLDSLEDIKDFSELKYNKNILPIDNVGTKSKTVNNNSEKK